MKLLFVILILVLIGVIVFLEVRKLRKRILLDKAAYDKKYEVISNIIDTYDVDERNYDWICSLLCNLQQMKYKNREKSQVLAMRFFRRFESVVKKGVDVV